MADLSETSNAKTRRRMSVKTASRPGSLKVKSTIHLSLDASRKLDIHATMMGLDRSSLVEKLIHDSLRRWIVSDRGGTEGLAESETA